MEGVIILDYTARISEAVPMLAGWLAEGRPKQTDAIAHGLENAPTTLARLFQGKNFGEQLLQIANPDHPVRTG